MAKRILAWVKRAERETFTLRDCHQAHRGLSTVTAPSDLLPALEVLSERGFIRAEGPPHSGPGRKPGPIFRVSPYA